MGSFTGSSSVGGVCSAGERVSSSTTGSSGGGGLGSLLGGLGGRGS